MMIRKSSGTKSFINKLSDRLQKLEVDRAIATEGTSDYVIDPEVTEMEARYAKYKEEKAEKYKRLGREPTYHEQWAELTFSQFLHCVKGQGTPEERYQSRKREHHYLHGKEDGNSFAAGECTPECRYYASDGRIEDEEAIEWLDKGKARFYPSCQLSIRLNTGRCCSEEEYNNGLKGIE